jgi:hypothetical protein
MEAVFIKYRKALVVLCIIVLLFLPFKIYEAPAFHAGHVFSALGYWLNTLIIFIAVPICMLIYLRRIKRSGV